MRNLNARCILSLFAMAAVTEAAAANTDSKGRTVPPNVTNDAELLLARCGQPSRDDTTENDKPHPPIPARIIEYKKQRLRMMFIPGGGANLRESPPFNCAVIATHDITTTR